MSTLYFHIPFCKQACHYCDFHFSTVRKTYRPVLDGMIRELEIQQDYLFDKHLTSMYFGGGTPSLLEEKDLFQLIEKAQQHFSLADDAEITLEANPDDLNNAALRVYRQAGINRLSIGTQSFFDADLKLMNRTHTAAQAENSIKRAQDAGFENLTIDLIYGMPGSHTGRWHQNVERAIALGVPHLSTYALTVEPKTALAKYVEDGEVTLPDEAVVANQYDDLCRLAATAGFEHYELSNFGKPGFHSRHNTSYWKGAHYLGIGPSAHSFNGEYRQWNMANNTRYSNALAGGGSWFEQEALSESDHFNEYLMTGLRTAKGISLAEINEQFGDDRSEKLMRDAQSYLECDRLQLHDNRLFIPEREWLISDRIISDLFWVV
jgi:oxygen-independent coproporphyrinogen-3 oxidase